MLRTFLIGVSLFVATAATGEPRHMAGQKDGVSYDCTADLTPDGRLVFHGVYLKSGDPFELTVSRRGHVYGWVGNSSVSFDVSTAARDRAVAELHLQDRELLADSAGTPAIR